MIKCPHRILWLVLTLVFIYPQASLAQSQRELQALQYALYRNGVYSGKIDGISGPATRSAISEYAKQKGIENDLSKVYFHLASNITWEAEWNEVAEAALIRSLETHLLDGPTARISERKLFTGDNGLVICANVNAKNAYGAYSGYKWIYFLGVDSTLIKSKPSILIVGPVSGEIESWCNLGFILGGD